MCLCAGGMTFLCVCVLCCFLMSSWAQRATDAGRRAVQPFLAKLRTAHQTTTAKKRLILDSNWVIFFDSFLCQRLRRERTGEQER